MSAPTPQQKAAIAARGDVLVVAGAGAGKTRALVDRCLAWLLDAENPGSLDQILMVTFTEAAAAEMRQRLRARLEEVHAARPSPRLAEQLALLETALICTLHSFCFRLVREHFYTLGLDPQLIVLPEERAQLLARQALDLVLQQNYSRQTAPAAAIQETIQSLGGDSDFVVRAIVLRLYHYAQTLPDPAAWFDAQTALFQQAAPGPWPGLAHGGVGKLLSYLALRFARATGGKSMRPALCRRAGATSAKAGAHGFCRRPPGRWPGGERGQGKMAQTFGKHF
jgi:ATP-dependent helicase/nuclease subunit A